jgi:hypothetical protein
MNVSEAQRLIQLEAENAKLKRLLAELMLDNAALKDVLSKNWVKPAAKEPWCSIFEAARSFAAGRHVGLLSAIVSQHVMSRAKVMTANCVSG